MRFWFNQVFAATGKHRQRKQRRRGLRLAVVFAVAAAAIGVNTFLAPVEPAHAVTYDAQLVKDIYTGMDCCGGVNYSFPRDFTPLGINAVFGADSEFGNELWITDGTEAGTSLVKDIDPVTGFGFPNSSFPNGFTPLGTKLVFMATDAANGTELWITDGTEAGTTLVKDIYPGPSSSFPFAFAAIGTQLVFNADDGVNGRELWITDGTEAGTTLVKDIHPGTGGCCPNSSNPGSFTALGSQLVFGASDSNGYELWITNGTQAGTTLVKDINPGLDCCGPNSSFPEEFAALGTTQLLFRAYDGVSGTELWITDGTEAGTTLFADLFPGTIDEFPNSGFPREMTSLGDAVVFSAYGGSGIRPWITDGTVEGTFVLKELDPGAGGESSAYFFTPFGTGVIFSAFEPIAETWGTEHGSELWISDRTPAGTVLVKDIYPGGEGSPNGSRPEEFEVVGDHVFFRAFEGATGAELWVTDGTEAGTTLVEDIFPGDGCCGPNSSFPYQLTAFGDSALFGATNELGTELWRVAVLDAAPTVTVEQAAGQADPTLTTPINFTVTFSEAVTGFDASDVNVAVTAGPALTATVTGTGPVYNVAVSGMTVRTFVTVTVPADAALDSASQPNDESTSLDNTVLFRRANSLPGVVTTSTNWGLRDSLSAGLPTNSFSLGARPLVPLSGDWDGDGLNTAGYYKAGSFYLRNVNAGGAVPETVITFGDSRGFPVSGDFNGDGIDDIAVYRNGIWQIRILGPTPQPDFSISFGAGAWPAIVPVAGDWDGNGTDGVGYYCLNASVCGTVGSWRLRHIASSAAPMGNPDVVFTYNPGTGPYSVVGDWDGNGTDTVGVKAGTSWLLRNANAAGLADITFAYGAAGDLPVVWAAVPPEL